VSTTARGVGKCPPRRQSVLVHRLAEPPNARRRRCMTVSTALGKSSSPGPCALVADGGVVSKIALRAALSGRVSAAAGALAAPRS
jgi:hypothetical protein